MLTILDNFGKQLELSLKDSKQSMVIGMAPNLYTYLQHRGSSEGIYICYWLNKIYIAKLHNNPCAYCLLHAIDRHLPKFSPSIFNFSSIIDSDPIISLPIIDTIEIIIEKLSSAVIILDTEVFSITTENLLTETECASCHSILQSTLPKLQTKSTSSYSPLRSKNISEIGQLLEDCCYGQHTGLVNNIVYDLQMPFAACTSYLALHKKKREPTLGRAQQFPACKAIACLEALERLAGFRGGFFTETIFSSFNELNEVAVNPYSLGLHSPEQYQQAHFPFTAYHADLPLYWIKALNLSTQKTVWIPRCFAFYGVSPLAQDVPIAFETSNGCAVGSTLEEAILQGIIELIERDAFLMTWYRRLPAYNITEPLLADQTLCLAYAKASLFTDACIEFFSNPMEHGVPTVFALARTTSPHKVATAAAGGCGFTYQTAAESALYELTGHQIRLQHLLNDANNVKKANTMLNEPDQVKSMTDHGLVNALAGAAIRFNFLAGSTDIPCSLELADTPEKNLRILQARLEAKGFQIIVVDQTPKFMRKTNLVCVKVLIPGLIPMTFGHRYTRLELPRLQKNSTLSFTSVLPHPFP